MSGAILSPAETHGNGSGARPQIQVERAGSITTAKQDVFLATLAATANVRLSLSEAGMSSAGLYKLRKRSAAFRRAWDEALSEGYARVEAMLLERALGGTPRKKGRGLNTRVEYEPCSERLATTLLNAHAKRVHAYRASLDNKPIDAEAVRGRLMRQLEKLAETLGVDFDD